MFIRINAVLKLTVYTYILVNYQHMLYRPAWCVQSLTVSLSLSLSVCVCVCVSLKQLKSNVRDLGDNGRFAD